MGVLFAAAVLCSGCGPRPLVTRNYYLIDGYSLYDVRDVGVLPFTSGKDYSPEILEKCRTIFVSELRRRNEYRPHLVTSRDLTNFEDTRHLDAVVRGHVIYYDPAEPFRFGLQVEMEDLETGQILWSTSHIFDARLKDVVQGVKGYYREVLYPHHPLLGHKYILLSMDKFIAFSCSTLVDTLQNEQEPEKQAGSSIPEGNLKARPGREVRNDER
ncbi:MAG: hypothetical protein GF333_03920 [Candidatus Omnitrophica bacterium]|nr:hypothetical protein [Candidatus Omnitrophota bacterium]